MAGERGKRARKVRHRCPGCGATAISAGAVWCTCTSTPYRMMPDGVREAVDAVLGSATARAETKGSARCKCGYGRSDPLHLRRSRSDYHPFRPAAQRGGPG